MTESELEHDVPFVHGKRPPGTREFTLRAVIAAMLCAAIIGASYPYVVMRLGFGPNISVVSAFLGYLMLGIFFRGFNRWENNIVQTAGTAAGQTAFMCVLLAAFDMLKMDPSLHFTFTLTPWASFAWLTTAGLLGVLLAVPMRRHFIVDEKLPYVDGIAAAETLTVLDSRDAGARSAARTMGIGTVLSAIVMVFREDARIFANHWYRIAEYGKMPMTKLFGAVGKTTGAGVSWSLLSLGSGMMVGMRINASMLLGTFVSWVYFPAVLVAHHVVGEHYSKRDVLLWVMWPATGMLVAGGLTALALRWKILVKTFQQLATAKIDSGDFPMQWVAIGVAVSGIGLVFVQKVMLGMAIWQTLVAILLSVPLMLVGLRVLGETNWGPISAMSNMMQAVFGLLAPGQITANMVGSGVCGTVASESEGLIQDYKTGELIDSTPRYLTYAQLMAIPVGAAAVSWVYPLLRKQYGIGGDHGLQSPVSQKWAGFATLLSKGIDSLPAGALTALVVGVVLGILFTVLESTKWKKWTPSPTGIGIGMLVPANAVATMFIGGVADWVWSKTDKKSYDRHLVPVASGFIAGEALVAVIIPILVAIGILHLVD